MKDVIVTIAVFAGIYITIDQYNRYMDRKDREALRKG